MKANAPLAKLDIASVYGTEGWGFELLRARQKRLKSVDFGRFFFGFCYRMVFVRISSNLF